MSKASKQTSSHHAVRLKIVIRRLPPHLPEDVFWQSVEPWVTDDTSTWKAYYPGKLRKDPNKENIPSRAYVMFRNEEQIALFSKEFDGHVFRDKQGRESQAVVEFAPFQKVPPPPERTKADPRMNTIEQDEDYRSFIDSLNAPIPPPSIPEIAASSSDPKTTPLLAALLAEKTILKSKEPANRAHAPAENSKSAGPSQSQNQKDAVDTKTAKSQKSGPFNKDKEGAKHDTEPKGKRSGKRSKPPPSTAPNLPVPTSASATVPPLSPTTATSPPKVSVLKQPKGQTHRQQQPNPKPPRAPKEDNRQQPATVQARKPKEQERDTPAPPSIQKPPLKVDPVSNQEDTKTPTPSAPSEPPRPRRGRPVIGLGSRQFEAALSHAGVPKQRRKDENPSTTGLSPATQPQKTNTVNDST